MTNNPDMQPTVTEARAHIDEPARRIIERIAEAVFTMQRECRTATEHGNEMAKECQPLFEQLGMSDEGDGWGFDEDDFSGSEPTVDFVRHWLLSSDHPVNDWERDFAAAIDARHPSQETARSADVGEDHWRPIEGAPKHVTCWVLDRWPHDGKQWCYEAIHNGLEWYHGFGDGWPKANPTHFMPELSALTTPPADDVLSTMQRLGQEYDAADDGGLREALEPFALEADNHDRPDIKDADRFGGDLTFGDLRRARHAFFWGG